MQMTEQSPVSEHGAFRHGLHRDEYGEGIGGTGIASVEHIAGFAFQPLVVHMIEPIFMCCDGGAFFVQPSQVKACDSIIVANCGRLLDMPSTNAESPLLARGFAGFCPEASRIAEHHDREQRLGSHGFRRILPSPVKVRVMIVDQMFEANPVSQPIVHIEVHARRSSSSPCSLCSSSSSAMMRSHHSAASS